MGVREYLQKYKSLIGEYSPARSILPLVQYPSVRHQAISGKGLWELAQVFVPNVVEPNPHQTLVRQHMKRHSGLLVVHGTGTGKTLTASFVAKDFLDTDPRAIVIVVCPTSVRNQFYAEIGTVVRPQDMPRVFPFGFTELYNALQEPKYGPLLVAQVKKFKTLFIIDEAHYLNKQSSSRMAAILDMAVHADKVMAMTATPITNKVDELAVLLAFVRRDKSLADLKVQSMSDAEFRKLVECYVSMYHVNTSTHPDFPKMVEHPPIVIPLSNKNYSNAVVNNVHYTTHIKYSLERVKLIRHGGKLEKMYELLQKHPGKTIVYVEMKENVTAVQKFLERKGIRYFTIVGDVDVKKRNGLVRNFSNPNRRDTEVMILSQAGAAGLDFKYVRNVIFLELPWNYSDYKQIMGRAVRFKSHNGNATRGEVNIFVIMYASPRGAARKVFNETAYSTIQQKKLDTDAIMAKLVPISIEKTACGANRNKGRMNAPNTPRTPSPFAPELARFYVPNIPKAPKPGLVASRTVSMPWRWPWRRQETQEVVASDTRTGIRNTLKQFATKIAWLVGKSKRPSPPPNNKNKTIGNRFPKRRIGKLRRTRSMSQMPTQDTIRLKRSASFSGPINVRKLSDMPRRKRPTNKSRNATPNVNMPSVIEAKSRRTTPRAQVRTPTPFAKRPRTRSQSVEQNT